MDDLKDRLTSSRRNVWRVVGAVLVIGSIAAGFNVLGTPQSQRMLRYDLQNIQWQIINYWQQKGVLPTALADLEDPISGFIAPVDPQTRNSYEYKKVDTLTFELCAEFNKLSQDSAKSAARMVYPESMGKFGENWQHEAGRQCFSRTIDPELYPVRPKI